MFKKIKIDFLDKWLNNIKEPIGKKMYIDISVFCKIILNKIKIGKQKLLKQILDNETKWINIK